jgi:hypothetical protein
MRVTRWCLRLLAALLGVTGLGLVSLRCDVGAEVCHTPGALDTATNAGAAELPSWAIGDFAYHHTDIFVWHIEADGTFYQLSSLGDANGCGSGWATWEEGRVRLRYGDGPAAPEESLATTVDGRFWLDFGAASTRECRWEELEPTALCGRDPGGCGGWGEAVACSWEEASQCCSCDASPDDDGAAPGDP